jgi:hypothetical protein
LKDFVIRNAEEYLHTYANRRAHIVAHNKAYGHIEAVRGKPKVDEDGKVIKDEIVFEQKMRLLLTLIHRHPL